MSELRRYKLPTIADGEPPRNVPSTPEEVQSRVFGLLPTLRKHALSTEKMRRMHPDNLESLIDAGVFRLTVPNDVGAEPLLEGFLHPALRPRHQRIRMAGRSAGWRRTIARPDWYRSASSCRSPPRSRAGKFLHQPEREVEGGGHRTAAQDVVLLGQDFGDPQIDLGITLCKRLRLGPCVVATPPSSRPASARIKLPVQ